MTTWVAVDRQTWDHLLITQPWAASKARNISMTVDMSDPRTRDIVEGLIEDSDLDRRRANGDWSADVDPKPEPVPAAPEDEQPEPENAPVEEPPEDDPNEPQEDPA